MNVRRAALRTGLVVIAVGVRIPVDMHAQVAHAATAADSASLARGSYRAAVAAHARGDLDSAMRAITHAVAAWPTQPAYVRTMALIAARRSDAAGLVRAIQMLTRFEAGGAVDRDSAVSRMAALPAVKAALARWSTAVADRTRSAVYATLSDSTIFPEGMDVDARTGAVYVASVRHGTVVEHRLDGSERELPLASIVAAGVLAVRIDTARNVLWATTSGIPQRLGFAPADSALASLVRIRLSDGMIERSFALPTAVGGRTLGDVAISSNGDILLTDSQHPALFVLRNGADTLISYTDSLFRSLQGIAPAADGRGAYVADYSHGLLFVDLGTGRVVRVADAPGTTTLGIDGIVRVGSDIIAVQNGIAPARIVRLALDSSGMRIVSARTIDRNVSIADEPTIGALLGDSFLYVANSQWEKHDARGARVPGTSLTRPVILRVPLSRSANVERPRDPLPLRARDALRRALRGGRGVPSR